MICDSVGIVCPSPGHAHVVHVQWVFSTLSKSVSCVVLTALSADGNCYVVGDGAQGPGTVFLNHGSGTCQASGITTLPTTTPTTPNATTLDQWAQGW